ncbi:MAG: alpha/beta fold hydrolase [Phycisphaerales bacterium]
MRTEGLHHHDTNLRASTRVGVGRAAQGVIEMTDHLPDDGRRRQRRRVRWRTAVIVGAIIATMWLTGCMERLFYQPTREPTPAPRSAYPQAEVVRFESADGTRLCGWFLPSRTTPRAEAATIVHVHGNAGSMASHLFFVENLPAEGFNVLLFDYRGYGESDGSPWKRGPLIEDAQAAVRTARTLPGVDPGRLALFGQSLGGGIATIVMASDPDIRSAVLESPLASWRDVAASALGGDPPGWWARSLATWLIADGGSSPRPIDAIASIDRPILILHGDADEVIPVSQGKRLAQAAPNAELLILPGGRHNTLQSTHPEVRRAIVEFLRRTTAREAPVAGEGVPSGEGRSH